MFKVPVQQRGILGISRSSFSLSAFLPPSNFLVKVKESASQMEKKYKNIYIKKVKREMQILRSKEWKN